VTATVPALPALPVVDVERGIATMGGQVKEYQRLLQLFSDIHGQDMQRLRERRAAGDLQALQRLAHSLRGAAGSLAATAVTAAAEALETAARHRAGDDEIERHIAALDAVLTPLLAAIRADTSTVEPEPVAPVDTDALEKVLATLRELLAAGDLAAHDLVRAEAPLLRQALGAKGVALLKRIEAFDYTAALALLTAAQP
jgi:HPt (histidine-containing phosphotransfer) domain-containing protein